jgi:hypothetical protein
LITVYYVLFGSRESPPICWWISKWGPQALWGV